MGNPFSKSSPPVDPEEERRKEEEKMRKMRESMYNKTPVIQKKPSENLSQTSQQNFIQKNNKPEVKIEEKKGQDLNVPEKSGTVTTPLNKDIKNEVSKSQSSDSIDLNKKSSTNHNLKEENKLKSISEPIVEKKPINKENTAIEKIFKITLNPENNKFSYLQDYHMKLEKLYDDPNKICFSLVDLDELLLGHVFLLENVRKDPVGYLIQVYHRAVELVEIR